MKEKLHIREGKDDIISKERRYIKEGESTTTRFKKRKREKSEDNSKRVIVLLIKMNEIDRGRIHVFFVELSYYFNLVCLVEMDV